MKESYQGSNLLLDIKDHDMSVQCDHMTLGDMLIHLKGFGQRGAKHERFKVFDKHLTLKMIEVTSVVEHINKNFHGEIGKLEYGISQSLGL